ncbi:MAG: AmmeMemoRadiSam system protein B [Phycisphaerales bacterium]|nr:MAG: AmmeMemoRadiSam system protein B [Phycisphaerales bacterium]
MRVEILIAMALIGVVAGWVRPGRAAARDPESKVRPAQFAGSWYPGDGSDLAKEIDDLLAKASAASLPSKPVGIISPHAGYRFSAPVAASAYACLRGHNFKRVIVMAFSHRGSSQYQGVDVPQDLDAYSTPLGEVPIDRKACDLLRKSPIFVSNPGVDRGEHSLELQLPFLQRVLKDFALVPLYVGRMTTADYADAARAILPLLDGDTLLVTSTDFTHFGPRFGYVPFREDLPGKLRELAEQAAKPLLKCDFDGFVEHLEKTRDTICGRGPVSLMLRTLSMHEGATGIRTGFDTSGQLTGDWSNSVTYQSFVFTRREGTLGAAERDFLLKLARQTVTAHLKGQALPEVNAGELSEKLRAKGACFVTLKNHGDLRGCIGNMTAETPLFKAVIRNAVSACKDRRFVMNPVTAAELNQLDIEISYLTPMKLVNNTDEIVVGQHGLLISKGWNRGVLLPQVAYERGWTREEFLAHTCRKAGLPVNAWKEPDARIQSFTAEVFAEPE